MAKKKNQESTDPSICLVMIVKNESQVIKKCLESVKDYIHYWVICDTGSTDGTQQIIKEEILKILAEGEGKKTWEVNFKYSDQGDMGTAEETMTQEKEPTLGDVKEKFNKAYGKIVKIISVKEKK